MLETSARLLRLLSLLQTPRDWAGAELAEQLDVDVRTVRRDIDKLRALGYPVHAARGVAGYRLGAGTRLPPLLLDDEAAARPCAAPNRTGSCTAGGAGTCSRGTSTARTGGPSGSTGCARVSPPVPGSSRASCPRTCLATSYAGSPPTPTATGPGSPCTSRSRWRPTGSRRPSVRSRRSTSGPAHCAR